jgi:hypothetical protein
LWNWEGGSSHLSPVFSLPLFLLRINHISTAFPSQSYATRRIALTCFSRCGGSWRRKSACRRGRHTRNKGKTTVLHKMYMPSSTWHGRLLSISWQNVISLSVLLDVFLVSFCCALFQSTFLLT